MTMGRALFLLETLATVLVLVRIALSGLYKVYTIFSVYLVLLLTEACTLSLVPNHTDAYGNIFMAFEVVVTALNVLVVLELYSQVFHGYVGVAKIAKRSVRIFIGLSIAGPLLFLFLTPVPRALLEEFFVFQRTIYLSLLLFVFLISAFLVYYPVKLCRNVVIYTIGYAVFFLSKAAALFLRTWVGPATAWTEPLSEAVLAVIAICLLCWAYLLNEAGETREVTVGPWSGEDQERVLQQLRSINNSLMRTAKR